MERGCVADQPNGLAHGHHAHRRRAVNLLTTSPIHALRLMLAPGSRSVVGSRFGVVTPASGGWRSGSRTSRTLAERP